jgi:hypothetical protein
MARTPKQTVRQSVIQRIFNDEGYLDQVLSGELRGLVTVSKHRRPPDSDLPFCTHSQRVAYYDDSHQKIVEIHRYLQPDGTIGASGLPDPKELLHDGVVYIASVK